MEFLKYFKICRFLLITAFVNIQVYAYATISDEGVTVTNTEKIREEEAKFNSSLNQGAALDDLSYLFAYFIGLTILFLISTPITINLINRIITNISNPPASLLLKIAKSLPNRYGNDLEQNISDMRLEYYEALSKEQIWRVRFIVADYYIRLAWNSVRWIVDKVKVYSVTN